MCFVFKNAYIHTHERRIIRRMIRVRQIIRLKFENGTVLILDGQSAWLYPSVFQWNQFLRILKMNFRL